MSMIPQENGPPALAALELRKGPRLVDDLSIRSPVVTIGQGSHNDVVLADDSVSKTHARLEYDAGGWRITDLGSTNGTFVEDVRLAPEVPTPLAYGSGVRLGGVSFWFKAVESADLEAARARYVPPASTVPLAQRGGGFRLPLWVLLVVLFVIAVAALVFLFGGEPEAASALREAARAPALALAGPPPVGP